MQISLDSGELSYGEFSLFALYTHDAIYLFGSQIKF